MWVLCRRVCQAKEFLSASFRVALATADVRSGIRTARYTISDIDARITDYENKLRELKTGFLEGVAVQTEIIVVRMMNVVEAIGGFADLRVRSDIYNSGLQRNPST